MGDMEWQLASGRGAVFAFNIHRRAFDDAFVDEIPYVLALVELDEGPLFLTRIVECEPESVKVGLSVTVVFEDFDGYTLPYFKPASGATTA
jgi:uncharacterized OB-fold protein